MMPLERRLVLNDQLQADIIGLISALQNFRKRVLPEFLTPERRSQLRRHEDLLWEIERDTTHLVERLADGEP